jgi:hypothetical protein
MTELELQNKLASIDQQLSANRALKLSLNSELVLIITVFMVGIVFGTFVI